MKLAGSEGEVDNIGDCGNKCSGGGHWPFFERCWVDPRIDADSHISKKNTGASSGGLFLSGRPQCLRSDVYAAVLRRSSVFENPVEVRNP